MNWDVFASEIDNQARKVILTRKNMSSVCFCYLTKCKDLDWNVFDI